MLEFDRSICSDYQKATSREWLETNGIGGFACGTISGSNTRRYHGLLTAATRPPLGRITMLSKFEEVLIANGRRTALSSNLFGTTIAPKGYKYISRFKLDPFPVWQFVIGDLVLEKKLFMVHGENTTVCQWTLINGDPKDAKIELKPLISFVDYHHLQHHDEQINTDFHINQNFVAIMPYNDLPPLYLNHTGGDVEKTGHWYNDFVYSIETERGFDDTEDLFQPFSLTMPLAGSASVLISLTEKPAADLPMLEKGETERRRKLVKDAGRSGSSQETLILAADQFIVSRGNGSTILAGYPWFSDWGRDTMISLPGLALETGRPEIAKNILIEYSNHISDGMIPNRFPDQGETAEYNTIDASLWYFEAVRAYVESTGDIATIEEKLYTKLAEMIAAHMRGTRFDIHVDTDGLLFGGSGNSQLTWMDAKYGDESFTPRIGKPVEIQALWFNALCTMADLAHRFGDDEDEQRYRSLADLTKQSFNAIFWNDAEQCLFDVVNNGSRDASVRPNQVFAVSLHHSLISDPERAKAIVDKVKEKLLTPYGLRSLSPDDPLYRGIYIGSPYDRDSSYHQGTVWGWLIGPFVKAHRKVYPDIDTSQFTVSLLGHLSQAGIGQVSEIFDGDSPHEPRGCFAQAWSIAELIKSLK